jgi:hypothetical protein
MENVNIAKGTRTVFAWLMGFPPHTTIPPPFPHKQLTLSSKALNIFWSYTPLSLFSNKKLLYRVQ